MDPSVRHDPGYKRIFSHPQAIQELLRGFLWEDWVQMLDLSTLERVNPSFVSDDLRERHGDLIWKVQQRGAGTSLYLFVEFQSTSYHFMAVRFLTYSGLLLEQIIRLERLKPWDPLPVVLPLVLYNGRRNWLAPLDLPALVGAVPSGLESRIPRLSYLLVDQFRLDLEDPALADNWLAGLFQIETCLVPEDLPKLTARLATLLPHGQEPELWRSLNIWLRAVLHRKLPGVTIPESLNLEDATMLDPLVVKWRKTYRMEGMREVLLEQMKSRFGPLPLEVERKVEGISSIRALRGLAGRILVADSLHSLGV